MLLPILEQRIDDLPRRLHLIAAREQRHLADHHVEQQRLVGRRRRLPECLGVAEVHVHRRHLEVLRERDRGARHLDLEIQRHPLVGLYAHHQRVGLELAVRALTPEHQVRWRLERHGDLRIPLRHALAGSQEERNALPSPVVDVEPDGGVRRRLGIARHVRLVAVARHEVAIRHAGPVLRAHRTRRNRLRSEPPH